MKVSIIIIIDFYLLFINMMRNTLRNSQQTQKVSVKMLTSTRPLISKQTHNRNEENKWQSPPNHIESETSVSLDPFYPQ